MLHRRMAERAIGRPLKIDEYVHHINGNHYDNRPGNLLICGTEYHAFLHRMMKHRLHRGDLWRARYRTRELADRRIEQLHNAMTEFLRSEGTLAAYQDPVVSYGFPTMKRGA